MAALTKQEQEVMDHLAQAWNAFLNLHKRHPDEVPDFRKAIHEAQRIILSRPTLLAMRLDEDQ